MHARALASRRAGAGGLGAQEIDREVVWALENCRHVSYHLERCLLTAG